MYTPLAEDGSVERLPFHEEKKSWTRHIVRSLFGLIFAISLGCNILLLLSRRSAQYPNEHALSLDSNVTPFGTAPTTLSWMSWVTLSLQSKAQVGQMGYVRARRSLCRRV